MSGTEMSGAEPHPELSVVIPTFNRRERLQLVLEALAAQTLPRERFEVVVVSDGSSDGTDEYLDSRATPLPVVHVRQDNAGPAAARNTGIRLARGRLVLFIDDDVVATPQLLARHLERHGDRDDLVVIGPMLNAPGFHYEPWVAWEQAMLEKQYEDLRRGKYPASFRQFYTGNASVARQRLLDVNGFDTTYKRAEDVELAQRLDDRGATFSFDEAAGAHHHAERPFRSWLATAKAYGTNEIQFIRAGDQHWRYDYMIDEFRYRNGFVRALVQRCAGRPRLSAVVEKGLHVLASTLYRVGVKSAAFDALSGLYNVAFYGAAATEYGDGRAFARVLRGEEAADGHEARSKVHKQTLLTVSGTIPTGVREAVAAGERPRVDYIEIAAAMNAEVIDHAAARRRATLVGRAIERVAGANAMLAWFCFRHRSHYAAIVTDGEQVGLPLAAMLWPTRRSARPKHAMIVHILSVPKKVALMRALGLRRRIDSLFVYSSWQQRFAVDSLHFDDSQVHLTTFMVDTEFFAPGTVTPSPRTRPMICAAGLEFRDYDTLVEAVDGLDVDVVIAAASPWSRRESTVEGVAMPDNVTITKLSLFELRQLYADATFAVMPLKPVQFQAGITTILEAMSMGKAVVCSRTEGQTDTITDGVTGVYVPPADAAALRSAIVALLDDPARAAALGAAAREWVVEHAELGVYAERLAALTR